MKNKFFGENFVFYVFFILLPIFTFFLGYQISERQKNEISIEKVPAETSEKKTEKIDLSFMRDALKVAKEHFVDPEKIDPDKIKFALARAVIWSLDDPYSEFMTPEEMHDFADEIDGNLEGIGAELTVKNGAIVVVSPLRDSPAEKAGLLPNDVVLKINDEKADADKFISMIKKIRGKPGTKVAITIFRPKTGEEKTFEITRKKLHVKSVKLKWREKIAILEVSQFGTDTEKEFNEALAKALAKNPRGIILDLRFNGGGFLDTAIKMVSAFLKDGKVVIQEGRPPETLSYFVTGNVKTDLPLVILQNGGSASASEIVAGAIQDHGRGTIIGEQSFGKGTVQDIIKVHGGANVKITVAKWLTPKGNWISEVGITPDIKIPRTDDDFENDRDPQLDAAVDFLKGKTPEEIAKKFNGEIPQKSEKK